jgi:GAGA factor
MSLSALADNSNMAEKQGEDDVYEIAVDLDAAEIPTEWRSSAQYELEQPAKCPYCRAMIRTLRVLRLTRTNVSFTSTLPRSGRAMVCPECDRILSAEVSGLL